jgi:hypothetical protein
VIAFVVLLIAGFITLGIFTRWAWYRHDNKRPLANSSGSLDVGARPQGQNLAVLSPRPASVLNN